MYLHLYGLRAACSLAFSLVAVASVFCQQYQITVVPMAPGMRRLTPMCINNKGWVVGSAESLNTIVAFVYRNGATVDIGTPFTSGRERGLQAINDIGQMVGIAATSVGHRHAFVYDPAGFEILVPNAFQSLASDINAFGISAGTVYESQSRSYPAVLYGPGTYTRLPTGGSGARTTAINDFGTVVGRVTRQARNGGGYFEHHACSWSVDGVFTELGPMGVNSEASDVNNLGQITGNIENGPGSYRAFIYRGQGIEDISPPQWPSVAASSINAKGEVVGTHLKQQPTGDYHPMGGFIFRDGVATDLDSLIDPSTGYHILGSYDNNDLGQILCDAVKDGVEVIVILTPSRRR
jgi:probable HAF family extracellular repeat protein